MKLLLTASLALFATTVLAAPKDVNVVNTPTVNVNGILQVDTSTPLDVEITNTDSISVRSAVRRMPVSCVVPAFQGSGASDAICASPEGLVTPVPSGMFLAITDVIASSQAISGTAGQAVVRVSSRNQGGVQFGAGIPLILHPGETQSLHLQSPAQVLPAGRTPTASVGVNFGDVFPVEVRFTGYLVPADDLGR